ncbi:hypothetical protein MTR_8g063340 [Medicago truncatula]|uniref:Uncharacterized protein n=1 Tax=Medicago truncatula TaxID=3880 RepID=G7LFH3_MEDTR|nr:hypothetical protein MTR_8g063340 [Medicago truncatula]
MYYISSPTNNTIHSSTPYDLYLQAYPLNQVSSKSDCLRYKSPKKSVALLVYKSS